MSSDLGSASDEELLSSASTASAEYDEHIAASKDSQKPPTALPLCSSVVKQTAPASSDKDRMSSDCLQGGNSSPGMPKRSLHLLDMPMEILKEIIKEVTHTNDLTSLTLTCSVLHSLAIPHMYSRFDIVWPDTMSSSDHPAGVDALSYGLATLVMGEDTFREVPGRNRLSPCPQCGCNERHPSHGDPLMPDVNRRVRRGNYYAQYTRKFSVGNGPLIWVQEYSVTKETGKMLGTLVALAVARMVNLEFFTWDMPTGVSRDVWIALASLADRPGHECRLEKVWVRWHDNREHLRSVPGTPTALSMALPGGPAPSANVPPPLQKYGHVEYPTLSILPPLKSLSVLDIDEASYLDEMGVLIDRSRDRLKELRIGISQKACKADWLKPVGDDWSSQQNTSTVPGWPRIGGVFGILSRGGTSTATNGGSAKTEVSSDGHNTEQTFHQAASETLSGETGSIQPLSQSHTTPADKSTAISQAEQPSISSSESRFSGSVSGSERTHRKLRLETLELERVHLSTPVMLRVLDWTQITHLTILRCEDHEKLWRSLRRHYTPSSVSQSNGGKSSRPKNGKGAVQDEFPLRIKHLHTDTVSPPLLLFIKDAVAPNSLESLVLQEAPQYDSIVSVEAIHRNVIRKHRQSLRKLLIDSADRTSTVVTDMHLPRWRRWMFTREIISFITSGRMPQLRELGMAMHSNDWHFFLQRLPNIPQLRALYIPHIIHRDCKELALQIVDIVSIRPEIAINYVGIQSKCYEILERRGSDKDEVFDEGDSGHVHPSGELSGSESEEASDDDDDDIDDGSSAEDQSIFSVDGPASSDEDSWSEVNRASASFRLREILFYDDKVTIFKARHGVL
ncbi:F-box domain-containing protein [Aspergillus sp. HF37]|nr:F-box domain-containing protein [Aspergillus sp. HF37]